MKTKRKIAKFLKKSFGFNTVGEAISKVDKIASDIRLMYNKEPNELTKEEAKACGFDYAKYFTIIKLLNLFVEVSTLGFYYSMDNEE